MIFIAITSLQRPYVLYEYIVTTKYCKRKGEQAFSLVEVVVALGVITFACVSLLALMANGLTTINHSISNTVEAEITQSMINMSQVNTYSSSFNTNYYFDAEGTLVTGGATSPNIVYTAVVTPKATGLILPLPYTVNSASACVLQVAVSSISNPTAKTYFSMVWANSGN